MSINSLLSFPKFLEVTWKITPNILDNYISGVRGIFLWFVSPPPPPNGWYLLFHDSVGHKVVFFHCDWMIETKEKNTQDMGKHHKSHSCAYFWSTKDLQKNSQQPPKFLWIVSITGFRNSSKQKLGLFMNTFFFCHQMDFVHLEPSEYKRGRYITVY